MPERKTLRRAEKDAREGKPVTTQAGEFVREELEHVREGKHGVASRQQAVAIGLSKARRAGVPLPPPAPGKTSDRTRKKAEKDVEVGRRAPRVRGTAPRKKRKARTAAQQSRTREKSATRGPVRRKQATKKAAVKKRQPKRAPAAK